MHKKLNLAVWRKIVFLLLLISSATSSNAFSILSSGNEARKANSSFIITLTFTLSDYNGVNVSCNSSSDGAIDLTPTDGTAPYTFLWSTGATSEDLSGIPAGTYTVTVTDFLGEVKTGSVTLVAPALMTVVQDSVNSASCNGGADGAAYISVTGGVPGYSYLWSDASSNEDITNVIAGAYNVTVTDVNSCTSQLNVDIFEDPFLTLQLVDTDVSCNGASTGAINLTVNGGTPNFTFNWSNGSTSEDLNGLPAATYTVTVTDANGCSESSFIVISQPSAINLSAVVADVDCNGAATGAIDLTVSGGLPNYTFIWSNGSISEDPSGLLSATYTVTVTDANGCTATTNEFVPQPPVLSLSTISTNVACNGTFTGAIDLTVTGGTSGYTYNWSNGSSFEDPNTLSAGTYTVTVTDANNCTATTSAVVNEPALLTLARTVTNVSCNGAATGSINLTASGGTPGYNYNWSNGSSNEDISGLIAGTYTVTVTDANNCTASTSAIVTQSSAINLSTIVTNVGCNGASTGAVNLSVSGGTPGYTYNWSNGSSNEDISGLIAGTFTVTVTDANNCTATTSATVTQTTAINLSRVVTNVACNGASTGAINLTVSGGAPGYTYNWSNGSSNEDISGLIAGTYTVTVTDANNCTATTSTTVTQTTAISLSTIVTNVACNGASTGAVNLAVSGGTPGYTYNWSNGSSNEDISGLIAGTYTVTITDANSCTATTSVLVSQPSPINLSTVVTNIACNGGASGAINLTVSGGTPGFTYNWSNGSSNEDISGLTAATYTVTVTDANNCIASVNAVVSQTSGLNLSTVVTNVACSGAATGAINLTVSGGVPGYTFNWSNGSATEDISGIIAGTYTVTVTDVNSCTGTTSVVVSQPAALNLSTVVTNVVCNGGATGAINLTVSGGTPGYTYNWSNGSSNQDITGLIAGTYTVTVTDANNCTGTTSALVTQSAAINLSTVVTNVACNGASTGAVNLTVSGGTPGYTYNWSSGSSNEDLIALPAGTYTVTVTDVNNCTAITNATVTQSAPILLNFIPVNGTCNASNGSITVIPSGGTPNYTFQWNTGQTSQVITGLAAGTYTVTVTDAAGCTVSSSTAVGNTGSPLATLITTVNVSCNGGTNGSLDISVAGGTPAYNYLWSTGAVTQDVSGLSAATYTVTITDQNFCVGIFSFPISQPQTISASGNLTNIACNGGGTGAIDITVSGGTPSYTFLWSNGALVEDISALSAGTYTVTITDANACTHIQSFSLTQPSALSVGTSATQSGCGVGTGTATATPAGGTPGYSYLWSNGGITATISGLVPATYTVTVSDANNCTAVSSVVVSAANAPVISNTSITDVTCNGGNDGAIDISVGGGTPSYTYLWSNGAVTEDISGLLAGTYTVTVQDVNNCSTSQSFLVGQPNAVTSTGVVTNVNCNGGATGSINITPSGGNGLFTYLWSTAATTEDVSGLIAGLYTVTITDGNGCTGISSYTVVQANLITFGPVVTNVLCNGASTGSINLNMAGGTPPFTFLWSNGFTGEDPVNLAAGSYTVTVTDINSCTRSRVVNLSQPSAINAVVNTTNASCGVTNGTATVIASGGTGGLTYLWNTGATVSSISSLAAGTYTVTVTDAALCTATASGQVVTASGPVISSVVIDSVSCYGDSDGAINITTTGGALPLTFIWSNGALTEDVTGLIEGVYTVTVTDQNSCTTTGTYTIAQPDSLQATFSSTPASCGLANGALSAVVTGGTPPYLYLWSTGGTGNGITGVIAGTYTVTVTDANNCSSQFSSTINGTGGPVIDSSNVQNLFCNNDTSGAITIYLSGGAAPLSILWSNGANTQNVSNLTAGNYTVTVTDFAGCSVLQTFSVTQPPALLSPMTSQPSFCGQATGQAQANPTGGTPPYTYLWNNGQTTQSITALTAGTYNVTVTDANGCTRRRNVAVTLSNGPVISLVAQQDVICPGATTGSIDINVIGGITPYVYSWSQGGTQQDVSVLAAGTYTVVVTDSVACSDSAVFVILEPDTFNVVPVIQDASCGGSNGSISLTVSGATSPYTFLWAGGQTTSAISGLTAGTYTVTISDSNSCDTTLSFLVSAQSGPLAVLDSLRNVRCFGANTGRIYTSVSGGTVPFTYLWNDGNTNQDRLSVFAGTYTLTVSDAGGCTDTLSVTITQNAQITASFTSIQATCNQSNGSATVTPGGGVGPYTYLWETGSSAQTLTAIPAGTYSVTITDILGCTFLDSVAVSNSGAPALQLQNQIQPSCFGGTNGSLTVSISGGTTPYVVIWSNGDTGNTADSLAAGTYTVTVTDGTGCTSSQQFSLGQPPAIVLQLQSVGASCGQLNGLATVIATGGTGTFTYLWSNGVANDSIKNVAAGLFTVTVTDQNLCVRQDTIRVQNLNGPQLNVNQLTNVSCFGLSNGAINMSVSGGSNPFQYIWSSGQTTQDLNNIPAGNYSLIVTDNTGCKDTTFVTVTQPTDIAIQSAVVDASCGSSNGAAFVTVNGGVPAYTYLWSNGGTADSINNVVAGSYTVTVTDANGCTKVDNVIIGNLNGPAVSLVSMTAVTCPGDSTGQLAIDVLFGTPPFTYLWSNGSVSQNLSNVPAGIYTLTVTDDNGCTNLFVDTITEPSALQVNATLTEPSCNLSNGIIVAQTTGGTSGYTYLWNTGNASSTISGLNSGTYTVTVTDAASCIFDTSFTISNTGIPVISSVTVDSVSCFGTADGSIDIDISGGVTPYLYTWVNTSQTTQDVNNLAAGNYSVIVTDNRGCTASQAFNVSQPQELLISFAGLQNAACGLTNGEVVVNASGGIPGYSFLWSNGSVNDSLANLAAGSYTVTVTDFNGCSVSNIANISNLSGPVILAVDSSNITCNGGLDGFISITATGVSLPLTYSWAGLPDTDSALTNLSQGLYTVTITDALGCVAIRTITLTEPQPFTINSVSPQNNPPYNISCFGLADGELFLSVTGGTAPYNFVWSNGAITQNLQNLTADLYTVFITDDNNCGTYQTFLLTQPLQLVANAGTDLIICGENNVTLFADTPALGIGYWQVISSLNTISFSDSTSPSSTISNLSIGDNVLLWTISDGICSDDDLLTITVTSEIEAIGGTDRSVCISEVNLNATRPEFGYGYWTSLTGDVQIDDTSRAFTRVIGLNFGNNSFLWTVVNGGCRDSAVVNIFRRDSLECLPKIQLPTAFSPNFDGSNDYLVIKGLEEYPDNEIVVYNRWGQNVYTQKSYRNDWYGTDNEGYPLADGTYFVIVKVNFINKVYNTYIDLRR